jgi:hypothetical protein
MGSFNEVCAISHINIGYGDPVRLLFLTRNPYVESDEHEAQRGCYHHDNWFVRTPPIKGKYDDYGRCKFTEDTTTKLIVDCFQKDLVERPFGFNQYHAHAVLKGMGIDEYLQAAWQGRLLVQDEYTRARTKVPDNWPTWEKVHALLGEKFTLQIEGKEDGKEGFNAIPVMPGVVCVIYNSYSNEEKNLKKAAKVIEKVYDCKLIFKFEDRKNDPCLMVTAKGAFDNPSMLFQEELTKNKLNTHPEMARHTIREGRNLPVLAVMVREDVWQSYCNVVPNPRFESEYFKLKTVEEIVESLQQTVKGMKEVHERDMTRDAKIFPLMGDIVRDSLLYSLPFMTSPKCHLVAAIEKGLPTDELIRDIAELIRVEMVMARLCHPWHIPGLGGQDGEWDLRTKILSDMAAISKKELDEQNAECEEYEAQEEDEA